MVGYVAALHWIVDAWSGQHNNKSGTMGEEATSSGFRTTEMRRRGWRIFDSIAFDDGFGDVDHVAARPGLVVAVESKWASTPWRIENDRLDAWGDPLGQARDGARKIRLLLKHHVDVVVHPLVVVWGPGARTLPEDVNDVDGVLVVRGPGIAAIDDRLEAFVAQHPTESDVPIVMGAIKSYAAHAGRALRNGLPFWIGGHRRIIVTLTPSAEPTPLLLRIRSRTPLDPAAPPP